MSVKMSHDLQIDGELVLLAHGLAMNRAECDEHHLLARALSAILEGLSEICCVTSTVVTLDRNTKNIDYILSRWRHVRGHHDGS